MKKIVALGMVIIMMLSLTVCTFARDWVISPENPDTEYKITVIATEGGTAGYSKNPDGTYTVYSDPDTGHSFLKWLPEGSYEVISSDITQGTFVIRLLSDCVFTAYFDSEQPVKPWPENDSPKTGNLLAPAVIVAVVSLLGCAYTAKRAFNA